MFLLLFVFQLLLIFLIFLLELLYLVFCLFSLYHFSFYHHIFKFGCLLNIFLIHHLMYILRLHILFQTFPNLFPHIHYSIIPLIIVYFLILYQILQTLIFFNFTLSQCNQRIICIELQNQFISRFVFINMGLLDLDFLVKELVLVLYCIEV